jgi:hypothetical protein
MPSGARRAAKIAVAVVAVVLVLWVLFALVFPWVDRQLNDPVLRAAVVQAVVMVGPRRAR